MTTAFPTGLDNFTNPTPANNLSTPTVLHTDQHSNSNDAVEALEAKVGVDSSAVTSSLDYRVTQLENNPPSGGAILSSVTTWTDAQIKALQQTPFELVPAPGVGKTFVFIASFFSLSPIPTSYYSDIDADGYAGIGFGVDNVYLSGIIPNDSGAGEGFLTSFFTTNANTIYPIDQRTTNWYNRQVNYGNSNDYENQPLLFWCYNNNVDFSGGDVTNVMKITTLYSVVDL